MLTKPDLPDALILDCLAHAYGIAASQLEFLPLGADANTAVYRASSRDGDHFVKLRRGPFAESSVIIPRLLNDSGIEYAAAPLPNHAGKLWTPLTDFSVVLYPFIEGRNGFETPLSAQQWTALGRILRQMHSAELPSAALETIPREQFSPSWRQQVQAWQSFVERQTLGDSVAADFAAFMRNKRRDITALCESADTLAAVVRTRRLPAVICHGDLHVGNVLVTPSGSVYVVDWDTLVLAPPERDLMFAGMGLGSNRLYSPDEQAACFYNGYGAYPVDTAAIAYYRCERIVQDAAAYCTQILLTEGDDPDRREGLSHFRQQFSPGDVVERALDAVRRVSMGEQG
jgi:spectinomycin phosphotransferase